MTYNFDEIHTCRYVNERLATSGQPSEEQLQAIAEAGYEVMINLGLHDDLKYALPDQTASVRALGMQYVHIPVQFANPTQDDLHTFFAAMKTYGAQKLWVHCAANCRVTAFLGLFWEIEQGWSHEEAFKLQHATWKTNAVWGDFIKTSLAAHGR